MSKVLSALSQQEQINFLLTNRIPRRWATQFMGWFSQAKHPWITKLSLFVWQLFAKDLDLTEAKKQDFESLHDCFIRQLKPGARTIDERDNISISPCDAIVGECGKVEDGRVYQAKGFPYDISDLIPDQNLQKKYKNGVYVTLRLTSTMYHRFHAPKDCSVNKITYISGDTWNVNPIALKRIEKLFCKNERAVMELHDQHDDSSITLVPVAAILVASIKLHCLQENLDMKYQGPNVIRCNQDYVKGEEMGYFQHGSTIIAFASEHFALLDSIKSGEKIAMGQALFERKPNNFSH